MDKNSGDVDMAPALGKIITKVLSHWSLKCREKRCMLVEYVKIITMQDFIILATIRTEKHTLVFYLT